MIPKELIIIILGCVVVGLMMYRDDYKRKKEQKMQERLNQSYFSNLDDINRERNKRHD